MNCVRLTTGYRIGRRIQRVDVACALKLLHTVDRYRTDPHWTVTWQTYTGHVKVTLKSRRSDLTNVLRIPTGVALLTDGRFHISHTWVGCPERRWAAWFCREFIGHYATDLQAAMALEEWRAANRVTGTDPLPGARCAG